MPNKVVKGLDCHVKLFCNDCPYIDPVHPEWGCHLEELIADALVLLKEKEPVEVIEDGEVYEGWMSETESVKCWKCNGCDTAIYIGNDKPLHFKYCWNCGKAVKWE